MIVARTILPPGGGGGGLESAPRSAAAAGRKAGKNAGRKNAGSGAGGTEPFDLDALVAPGGLLLYHHFMEGSSHPLRGLLARGALREAFVHRRGYTALVDEVREDPADGRPLSFFVAQKPLAPPSANG